MIAIPSCFSPCGRQIQVDEASDLGSCFIPRLTKQREDPDGLDVINQIRLNQKMTHQPALLETLDLCPRIERTRYE